MTQAESAVLSLAQRLASEAAALPPPEHPVGATVAAGGIVVRVSIARGSATSRAYSDADLDIMQALQTAGPGRRMTAKEICRLTGYRYSGWLAHKLTSMAKDGLIVSHGRGGHGRGGYSPVAAAHE